MDTVIASSSLASRKSLARWLALGAATLATSASAFAQIESYHARVTQYFQQTSNAGPGAGYYQFDAQLRTVNVGDGEWANLMGSNLDDGIQTMTVSGRTWSKTSQSYGTLAALKADYPMPWGYSMEIGGGVFVEPWHVSVLLDDQFPDAVPTLTGSTFTGLNNWNPNSGDFLMTFNSHSDLGISAPNYVNTYVSFYDKTTGSNTPVSWFLDNSVTSLLLDGDLFTAGHEYEGHLEFFHQYADPEHMNVNSITGLTTSFSFTTLAGNETPNEIPNGAVPEPSTYGLMGAGALCALALYRRQKQKRTA